MFKYCKKCGSVEDGFDCQFEEKCGVCGSIMVPVPTKYLSEKDEVKPFKELEGNISLLREELVKTSPEFDQYLFDHRDEIEAKKQAHNDYVWGLAHSHAVREGKDKGNKFGIECPYCHATNVRKITVASKAVHTAVFGIFSMGRNSKQWHCDHCGSDF